MTGQSDTLTAPSLRWLLVPFAGLAVVISVVEVLRRQARQPRVSPVSEQWLREHGATLPE